MLAGITLFWGLNWPGMKIILSELTVWWFRASCLWIGGICLLALAASGGSRLKLSFSEIRSVAWVAVFNVCCWHLLSAYAVSVMPAGRASIVAFTMPLWATLFSAWLVKESVSSRKIIGLTFGITGLAVLIGPDLWILKKAPVGAISMLGAAIGWALGTVLFKKSTLNISIATHIGWQLMIGAIPLTVGAFWLEPLPDVTQLSTPVWLALIYIYIFPMVFCQWAYLKVVGMFPASIAAIGTMMIPVVGVYSSYLILDEAIGWRELLSLGLICSALIIVLGQKSALKK